MKGSNLRQPDGFTIIEVLIVLAIASLLLLMVFMIVPTVQRNARNYARKDAVNYIYGEMSTYRSDFGQYPMSGPGAGQDNRTAFVDGLRKTGPAKLFTIRYTTIDGSHEYPFSGSGSPSNISNAYDTISIEHGHSCNRSPGVGPGDTDYPLMSSHGGDEDYGQFAVWTLLENKYIFCLDNRN